MDALTDRLKSLAADLGFVLSGVTPAARPERYQHGLEWLDSGYAGEMQYLERRREAYASPSSILDGCSTLLMLAFPYRIDHPSEAQWSEIQPPGNQPPENQSSGLQPGSGRVARYAWGEPDYHEHVFEQLQRLKEWVLVNYPEAKVRGVVDTAPLLEREFAEAAGLGWVGKNTLLLNRHWGSYFFLAALLTDLPLRVDPPQEKGYCGTCRACLDACPTGAFVRPYVLDARRCLSYLTIEYRGDVDDALASQFGDWMFGCDVCQEVCPWNRRSLTSPQAIPEPMSSLAPADLVALLDLDEAGFRAQYRHTPLWRAKRRGVLRNACLVLGNQRYQAAAPALEALTHDPEPVIQNAARWALKRLNRLA